MDTKTIIKKHEAIAILRDFNESGRTQNDAAQERSAVASSLARLNRELAMGIHPIG